ncbi:MAG: hypothetical protein Fur0042_03230 [Cyanophyceae cyanobacterium]
METANDRLGEISFQGAIALTERLLAQVGAGQLDPSEVEYAIGQLVKTVDGARGFFVAYLTDDRAIAATPIEPVVAAIATVPGVTVELLVKNLVMAAAMALTHERQGDPEMAASSRRTSDQSAVLLRHLLADGATPAAQTRVIATLTAMEDSLRTLAGDYGEFLQKWRYDGEQCEVMLAAIAAVRHRATGA